MLTGKQFRLERATLAVAKNEEGKRRAVTVPRGASRLSRAPVTLGSVLQAGSPKVLFEATIAGAGNIDRHPYLVISPDGKQFLALVSGDSNNSDPITILLNWQAVLKK